MLENIVRHMERGEGVLQAALNGSKEVGFTIVSMTLSLVAVFIPVLFMGGILGRLLNEFAVTISVAILVSGVVSLSLTPLLCSRFLRPRSKEEQSRLYAASEKIFQWMLNFYGWSLRAILRHRRATMIVSLMILIATGVLFVKIPKGFLPSEDTGAIFGFTEAVQGISFEGMMRHQQAVVQSIQKEPYIESIFSSIGASGAWVAVNSGRIFIRMKPRSERRLHVDEIIQDIRRKTAGIPGIMVFLQNLPPIRIGGQLTKSVY